MRDHHYSSPRPRVGGSPLPLPEPTSPSPGEAAVLAMEGFETATSATEEDALRLDHLRMATPLEPPRRWGNSGPLYAFQLYLERHPLPWLRQSQPRIERAASLALQASLAPAKGAPPTTLASAVAMRGLRVAVIGAVLDALADFSDEELCTVTVAKASWIYTPAQLADLPAKNLKMQLEGDLKRTGTYRQTGPLVAFLHGEWEPTNGIYVLHYHIVTTRAKAAYMLAAFRALRDTYQPSVLIKRPLRASKIQNRVGQLTYLLKSYWPQRAQRQIDGVWKRERRPRRISEPYASTYLLWLARHRLLDLTIMNGTWSRKRGGSLAWKRFYLCVTGHERPVRRRRRKTATTGVTVA